MMPCHPLKRFAKLFFRLLILISCVLKFRALSTAQSPAARPGFDGPAELPRIFLRTSMADTPAPGKSHLVKAGDNLQDAVDRASCGDTLRLEAGATFTGILRLPQKRCDDLHWIIIRASSPDSDLPPEGTRMSPCYAGVDSLPGRPAFPCPAPTWSEEDGSRSAFTFICDFSQHVVSPTTIDFSAWRSHAQAPNAACQTWPLLRNTPPLIIWYSTVSGCTEPRRMRLLAAST